MSGHCFGTTCTFTMKMSGGSGVLLVALAFNFLNMADGNRNRKGDPLEIKLNLLRQDLNEMRFELLLEDEERRNKTENLEGNIADLRQAVNGLNLQTKMTDLQDTVTLQRSAPREKGLSTESQLRQLAQEDLKELREEVRRQSAKIASLRAVAVHNHTAQADRLSHLQLQAAGPKCGLCLSGFRGLRGETDRCRENRTLSVPELRFIRANGWALDRVEIRAEGASVWDAPMRAFGSTVRTDGVLPADRRQYWEVAILWRLMDSNPGFRYWWQVGRVGVRREGSGFHESLGFDDWSWAVEIRYHTDKNMWRYYCYHGAGRLFRSHAMPVTSPEVRHRLGFLLDPGAGTLTAVDVNTNTRICSILTAYMPGSQPLVPVVQFGVRIFKKRFRLPGVDPSRLPGVVTDLLHK